MENKNVNIVENQSESKVGNKNNLPVKGKSTKSNQGAPTSNKQCSLINTALNGFYQERTSEVTKMLDNGKFVEEMLLKKMDSCESFDAKEYYNQKILEHREFDLKAIKELHRMDLLYILGGITLAALIAKGFDKEKLVDAAKGATKLLQAPALAA